MNFEFAVLASDESGVGVNHFLTLMASILIKFATEQKLFVTSCPVWSQSRSIWSILTIFGDSGSNISRDMRPFTLWSTTTNERTNDVNRRNWQHMRLNRHLAFRLRRISQGTKRLVLARVVRSLAEMLPVLPVCLWGIFAEWLEDAIIPSQMPVAAAEQCLLSCSTAALKMDSSNTDQCLG